MDILDVLMTLFRCMQLCGLSQWMMERKTGKLYLSRLLEIYTICSLLVAFTILLFGIFNDYYLFRKSDDATTQIWDYVQIFGVRVAHFITILEAFVRRHSHDSYIKQIREMDRIFECSLNVDVDNR